MSLTVMLSNVIKY